MLPGQREVDAALAAGYVAEGFWPGRLITDYFEHALATDPQRTAVVDDRFGSITYAGLAEQVERLAFGLSEIGVSKGDFFILQLPNWYFFTVFHLALTYLGALTVNVPVTYRHHELRYIGRLTAARGMVIPAQFRNFDFVAMVDELRPHVPCLDTVFVVGERAGGRMLNYCEFMARPWESRGHRSVFDTLKPQSDDVTGVSFTSGTTGEPKGVMHTSNTFAAINVSVAGAYDLTREDAIFMPAPLGHSIGLMHGVRLALFLGGKLVLQEQWNPAEGIRLVARERAAFTAMAPPFLYDMISHPALAECGGLPSLKVFLCGGAFVAERLLRAAQECLPNTLTSALWGMTEGIGTACRASSPASKLLTTDGRPFPGTELRVVGPGDEDAPPGKEGELLMRGPHLFVGYYRRPELNATDFLSDGFFRTGDLASIDREGYVRITGRLKDLIVRGGVNISPLEIERTLSEDPRIERMAVVGMPDVRLGERVCAFVVLRAGATLTLRDLTAFAEKQGLSKQKWPERLERVSHLPMTASGKIQRHLLREWLKKVDEGRTDS